MLIDDLTNVLDNGSYLGGASATITPTPAGTVPAPTKVGNRILWSGPLAKGSTVTVTYQVRLTAPSNPAASNRRGRAQHRLPRARRVRREHTGADGLCRTDLCRHQHPGRWDGDEAGSARQQDS